MPTKTQLRTSAYDRQNRRAAEIILRDPERYAGALVEWARTVLDAPKIDLDLRNPAGRE